MTSEKYSGRSTADLRSHLKAPQNADNARLVSPLQAKMITSILHGYFGEKQDVPTKLAVGRANQQNLLFAWAICAAMSPSNVHRW